VNTEASVVILFCLATAVAITVRWLRVPYTVGLVLTGLAVGAMHVVSPPHLTRELLFAVVLPGLLFEAAFQLNARELRAVAAPVLLLAVPGVVASVALTGLGITAAIVGLRIRPDFQLQYGMLFGALVAATDPIAVVALFRSINVPERLTTLIDAESLFNDGTAIVLFTLLLGVVAGASTSIPMLVLKFILVAGGGAVVGLALAFVAARILRRLNDPLIEITITVIVAYGSFVLADQIGVSGVIATVSAGIWMGVHGRAGALSEQSRIEATTFWSYIAFALNSFIFLLVGFEVDLVRLWSAWPEILIAYLAMMLARAGVVFGVYVIRGRVVPFSWSAALTWGGLRGALSMVLALSLPFALPNRDLLITITFGVVLLSIVVQGLTMPALIRRLRLAPLEPLAPRAGHG